MFIRNTFYLMCMHVCPAHMNVHLMTIWNPQRTEETESNPLDKELQKTEPSHSSCEGIHIFCKNKCSQWLSHLYKHPELYVL